MPLEVHFSPEFLMSIPTIPHWGPYKMCANKLGKEPLRYLFIYRLFNNTVPDTVHNGRLWKQWIVNWKGYKKETVMISSEVRNRLACRWGKSFKTRTFIKQVTSSNPRWNTGCPNRGVCVFPHFKQANAGSRFS